jgi:hypothetical protein
MFDSARPSPKRPNHDPTRVAVGKEPEGLPPPTYARSDPELPRYRSNRRSTIALPRDTNAIAPITKRGTTGLDASSTDTVHAIIADLSAAAVRTREPSSRVHSGQRDRLRSNCTPAAKRIRPIATTATCERLSSCEKAGSSTKRIPTVAQRIERTRLIAGSTHSRRDNSRNSTGVCGEPTHSKAPFYPLRS